LAKKTKALKAALPYTLPVLTGFIFLGFAYGILMSSKGYGLFWTFLMSFIVFAGSAQYVAITFLTTAFNPLYALLMTLIVNARHLFYGLSLLEKYKDAGRLKPYLIFGLCDETFSIVCSVEPPPEVDRHWFAFFITALNHFYWVAGSCLGAILGSVLSFNTKGLDFALTALFVVIFTGQWKNKQNRKPAIVGVLSSAFCLLLFGPQNFIIPSMIVILAILSAGQKRMAEIKERAEEVRS